IQHNLCSANSILRTATTRRWVSDTEHRLQCRSRLLAVPTLLDRQIARVPVCGQNLLSELQGNRRVDGSRRILLAIRNREADFIVAVNTACAGTLKRSPVLRESRVLLLFAGLYGRNATEPRDGSIQFGFIHYPEERLRFGV